MNMVKNMSLRFIYGKSGTGKTLFYFNEIKKLIDENKKVYIITPEQFSFTAEKNLMDACGRNAVIYAEVITFERRWIRLRTDKTLRNLNMAKRLVFVTIIIYIVVFFVVNSSYLSADNIERFAYTLKNRSAVKYSTRDCT